MPIYFVIITAIFVLSLACIGAAVYSLNKYVSGETEFTILGSHLKTGSVAVALAGLGGFLGFFSFREVLKNLRQPPPPPREGGYNISFVHGMTFKEAALAVAESEDGTIDFTPLTFSELAARVRAQSIQAASPEKAIERLRFLVSGSDAIRPYKVSEVESHFTFTIS